MVEISGLRKGEEKFLATFEKVHKEKPYFYTKEEAERKVKHTIEEIKKEIIDLPEVKREEELHPDMPTAQITNILAQAIQLALNESVEEGLRFIHQTKNPYLIDAFHDILIGHFVELLFRKGNE